MTLAVACDSTETRLRRLWESDSREWESDTFARPTNWLRLYQKRFNGDRNQAIVQAASVLSMSVPIRLFLFVDLKKTAQRGMPAYEPDLWLPDVSAGFVQPLEDRCPNAVGRTPHPTVGCQC
jgi:hypothetical protein